MGHPVNHRLVVELLHEMDYSLQAIARPWKELRIRIATPSFTTSAARSRRFNSSASR
jgi:hypothetical protein